MSRLAAETDDHGRHCTAGKELEVRRSAIGATTATAGPPHQALRARTGIVVTTKVTTNWADNRSTGWL
jgi:hypothetical protein